MNLFNELNEKIKNALITKDKIELSNLRLLKSAIVNHMISIGQKDSEITDDIISTVALKEYKSMQKALSITFSESNMSYKKTCEYFAFNGKKFCSIEEMINIIISILSNSDEHKISTVIKDVKVYLNNNNMIFEDNALLIKLIKQTMEGYGDK